MVFSGRIDLRLVNIVCLNLNLCQVVEFFGILLFVEPRDPCTPRNLEVVDPLRVTAVVSKDGRVAKRFSLEDGEHRLGHGVVSHQVDGSTQATKIPPATTCTILRAGGPIAEYSQTRLDHIPLKLDTRLRILGCYGDFGQWF